MIIEEGIFVHIMTYLLGDYTESIEKNQLHISFKSLSAALKKIRIRKDVFYSLNLPIDIIQGEVETIEVIVQSLTPFSLSIFLLKVTVKCESQKEFVNEEENESIERIKKKDY
ncbi:hypothetical protein EHI8A_062440 [Entamoeba histolytica HM-1:IMSS-B]|uniref:Chorein N-terminal domain-containing protein n=6 Tax=Entamoeba histolytica TaxID=5759 RepID=C4M6V8_ENTH1|nr:hypothetical protein EHI_139290 [Entamoeba histolytica HM-1:IMSS]EMD46348.1 Hypothetical protein EHI5A_101980 [Entamoeba histolytica KU27]EMH73018.1 hypothetical protein EHI8A_062440 [Entamoeba histolytica HM-1:IMSS-B]EMS11675.1 hypothetical protein KM1_119240 [Entamoeba histolytica HM-3:IMSS]ENY63898.1 hypothetical protein EHI7A_065000 [Entamoeba histolytica HM-1:IMSS-A]GAT97238.1 hypothetical protein CL6EHI_139290 [Entamoeba histolytica]|eukprot:XP_651322.2 hypothetical protein EHI_139290 [Entamoeba histolytica HM-1:IMSS]